MAVRASRIRRDILVETRQRLAETTSKPHSAKSKYSLSIVHVADYLPNAPFVRCVTIQRFFLRHAGEEPAGIVHLRFDSLKNVVAGYQVNIGEIVRRCFRPLRETHGGRILTD